MHIHIHHTKSVPFPPVICPAIRPTGSRGLLSEWGVPDPLSVRNTSLNPDALTRLHSAWKAKSLFQLGPACLAAIDFVTMGKSSVKSRSKSLRESFNYFFSLLLLKLKAKRTHGLTHLVSIILWCAWFLLWKGHTLRQVTWGDSQQLSTEGESEEKSKCDAILNHCPHYPCAGNKGSLAQSDLQHCSL